MHLSTLIKGSVDSSEMPLYILQATRCCVPEYNNIRSHELFFNYLE